MTGLQGFSQRIRTAREKIPGLILAELRATGLRGEGLAKQYATERLKVRTGYLRRSIQSSVKSDGGTAELALRAGGGERDVRYAALQEYGGTNVPKTGKFLAIPVGPALTASGVPKYRSPRDVPGLRFIPILGGKMGLLVKDYAGRGKSGRGARSEVWFRLVRSVTVTGKHYLHDGFEEARKGLEDRLHDRITTLVGV